VRRMEYGLPWHGCKLFLVRRKVWRNCWFHIGRGLAETSLPGQFEYHLTFITILNSSVILNTVKGLTIKESTGSQQKALSSKMWWHVVQKKFTYVPEEWCLFTGLRSKRNR
jgi:hypothetical protein